MLSNQTYSFLGEIPLDGVITETSDEGTPIVISHPDSVQVTHLFYRIE